ncbi:hypothetical protein WI74_23850 [Burkholderia ubonensis]|nr:hypothetical protein WI74_23850 [Burkholderia ubonensis]
MTAMLLRMFAWLIITPLGVPVEPDVYWEFACSAFFTIEVPVVVSMVMRRQPAPGENRACGES